MASEEGVAVYLPDERDVWCESVLDSGSVPSTALLRDLELPAHGVDDMARLQYLHEASILENLQRRFKLSLPYTRVSEVVVSVNPFTWIKGLYTADNMDRYASLDAQREDLPPHVYSVGADAFTKGLMQQGDSQSILVSGESGAGKTETVKILLNFIARIAGSSGSVSGALVIRKIIEVNPLLESFGNSKTARNDNSSRFGKFTVLQFSPEFALVGSRCATYLLEKSRVVGQAPVERNYHIFYELLASSPETRRRLMLEGWTASDLRYLRSGDVETTHIEGVSDGERYCRVVDTLALLGVSGRLLQLLEEALATVLLLGELKFCSFSAAGDCVVAQGSTEREEAAIDSVCALAQVGRDALSQACCHRSIEVEGRTIRANLSLAQAETLRDALAKDVFHRIFQWLILVINHSTRGAAKAAAPAAGQGSACDLVPPQARTISVLDIFGFESFSTNRFEQLCINFANEKLQQKFTQDVFRSVLAEYAAEGIHLESVKYRDNSDVLALIEGPRASVLACLNEECLVPRPSDAGFLSKLKQACGGGQHAAFSHLAHRPSTFCIQHYAGKVEYSVEASVEKNRDHLGADLVRLMGGSESPLLALLFGPESGVWFDGREQRQDACWEEGFAQALFCGQPPPAEAGGAEEAPRAAARPAASSLLHNRPEVSRRAGGSFFLADTITSKFKAQLSSLLDSINQTSVKYVRCIKPNADKSPALFHRPMVVEQLRSAGMIEAIKISRSCFPYKLSVAQFLERYALLDARHRPPAPPQHQPKEELDAAGDLLTPEFYSPLNSPVSELQRARDVLVLVCRAVTTADSSASDPGAALSFRVGRSKVFYTAGVLRLLEEGRRAALGLRVRRFQALVRGLLQRKRYRQARASVVLLQSLARRAPLRRAYCAKRNAAVRLQARMRGRLARARVFDLRRHWSASLIQARWRGRVFLGRFRRLRAACVAVQRVQQMRSQRARYLRLRDAARYRVSLQRELADTAAANAALRDQLAVLQADGGAGRREEREGAAMMAEDLVAWAGRCEGLRALVSHTRAALDKAEAAATTSRHGLEIMGIEYQVLELTVQELEEQAREAQEQGRADVARTAEAAAAAEAAARAETDCALARGEAAAVLERAVGEACLRAERERLELQHEQHLSEQLSLQQSRQREEHARQLLSEQQQHEAQMRALEASLSAASAELVVMARATAALEEARQALSDEKAALALALVEAQASASASEETQQALYSDNAATALLLQASQCGAAALEDSHRALAKANAALASDKAALTLALQEAQTLLCEQQRELSATPPTLDVPPRTQGPVADPLADAHSSRSFCDGTDLASARPAVGGRMCDVEVQTCCQEAEAAEAAEEEFFTHDSDEEEEQQGSPLAVLTKTRVPSRSGHSAYDWSPTSESDESEASGESKDSKESTSCAVTAASAASPGSAGTGVTDRLETDDSESGSFASAAGPVAPLSISTAAAAGGERGSLTTPTHRPPRPPSPAQAAAGRSSPRSYSPRPAASASAASFSGARGLSPRSPGGAGCDASSSMLKLLGLTSIEIIDAPPSPARDKENAPNSWAGSSAKERPSPSKSSPHSPAKPTPLVLEEIERLANGNRVTQLLQSKAGLAATVFIRDAPTSGRLVGKPARIRSVFDTSFEGCLAIELCILSMSVGAGSPGTVPPCQMGCRGCPMCGEVQTEAEEFACRVTKKLTFGVQEVEKIAYRRGSTVPARVPAHNCLVVSVKHKGELNLVLEHFAACEAFVGAVEKMQQARKGQGQQSKASPLKRPELQLVRGSLRAVAGPLSPAQVGAYVSIEQRASMAGDAAPAPSSTGATDLVPLHARAARLAATPVPPVPSVPVRAHTSDDAVTPTYTKESRIPLAVRPSPPSAGTLSFGSMLHSPLTSYASKGPVSAGVGRQDRAGGGMGMGMGAGVAAPIEQQRSALARRPDTRPRAPRASSHSLSALSGDGPALALPAAKVCISGWLTLFVSAGAGAGGGSVGREESSTWVRRFVFLAQEGGEGGRGPSFRLMFGQSDLALQYQAFVKGAVALPADFRLTRTAFLSWSQQRTHNLEVADGHGAHLVTLQLGSEGECDRWFQVFVGAAESFASSVLG